jgi:putative endonuclease
MAMLLRKKKATQPTGRQGESLAAEFLVKQRYVIVEYNYRKPYGEVDIIARDGGTLVFIEVKTRKSSGFGSAFEAVDGRKQRRLSRIAQEYLQSRGLLGSPARFDVVAIRLDGDNRPVTIDHIKNAFDCAP